MRFSDGQTIQKQEQVFLFEFLDETGRILKILDKKFKKQKDNY